ncbi:MAG TPA: tlde1 domain-containing protein [Edaphobacter sp.]|nr:tlde1 domain-containing protein [Edaphobacter sp.]
MWTYEQSTGRLSRNGIDAATGYSGHEDGLNNPAMQDVRMVGPAPRGTYTIGPAQLHPHLGPITMELIPDAGNEMFGRSELFIHGDNQQMNHTASDGCLIFNRETRAAIAVAGLNGDTTLEITE